MRKISLIALAAAATVFGTSANAADLGGNCCADLEERIAELEATAARKGNRKVKLTVSGFVNEMVMFWDDGVESNAYVVTNEVSRTRFRFVGDAKINERWSAGYLLEIGAGQALSSSVTASNDDGSGSQITIRHSAWWLQNKELGKVWVGQTSSAADGITEINLANTGHFATQNQSGVVGAFTAVGTPFTMRNFMGGAGDIGAQIGEGTRHNVVKYETPVFMGFTASTAFGEDDLWDVALRYAGEFNGIKLAVGIGYQKWTDETSNDLSCVPVGGSVDCDQIGLSGAVMHVATGLYVHGAYGRRQDDNVLVGDDTSTQWYIQGGIERNFFGIGKTTVFGEYQQWDVGQASFNTVATRTLEMDMWGIGFNQQIDAAAMDLYMRYNDYSPDVSDQITEEDFQTFVAGGRISF